MNLNKFLGFIFIYMIIYMLVQCTYIQHIISKINRRDNNIVNISAYLFCAFRKQFFIIRMNTVNKVNKLIYSFKLYLLYLCRWSIDNDNVQNKYGQMFTLLLIYIITFIWLKRKSNYKGYAYVISIVTIQSSCNIHIETLKYINKH